MSNEDNPVAEAILTLARAINRLGNADAATPMGGLEALGAHLGDRLGDIASSINDLAEAIREHTPGEQS